MVALLRETSARLPRIFVLGPEIPSGSYLLRSEAPIEPEIARLLEQDPCTGVVARGLGAGDAPGSTHLLRVEADETWWRLLPDRLRLLL